MTIVAALLSCAVLLDAQENPVYTKHPDFVVKTDTSKEPVCEGAFTPDVESLSAYECPEWFRDAKFGIWAHWGPQCQPEDGDWYARKMYISSDQAYKYQLDTKGHPSEYGFKDWLPDWKADKFEPDSLVKLYKSVGARYFMALANHHDNFDLYDSRYQEWNSTRIGPMRDIIGEWAEACRKYDLPFGVSVHAAHAWCWYETSRGSDAAGPLKGVPYDGVLTKEDGKGKWWEGLDPQELYEQSHPLSKNNRSWDWELDRVTPPDQKYTDKFYNRTVQLINDYNPDIIYFDDTYLPLWPVTDAGLNIVAHYYNRNASQNGGKVNCVVTGKVLNDWQKETIVWDVERGAPDNINPLPWQTCTCIGQWHYDKHTYYQDRYKSSAKVIAMLVDVVSKNGNLLLNIPLRGDGSMDKTERQIVERIGAWMKINSESIYDTRPWKIFGEGPVAESSNPINAQGFNENKQNLGPQDVRFNAKGEKLIYATVFGAPEADVVIKSLGRKTEYNKFKIKSISVLGSSETISWTQNDDSLVISKPTCIPAEEALVFKITLR